MADQSVRGRFVWHELATPDQPGALAFYTKALGWKEVPWEEDPRYSMFAVGSSDPLGGAGASVDGMAHWTPFIGTADIDATVRHAMSLGAAVKTPVTAIPNGGQYAVLADPQGATFGVHASSAEPGPEKAAGTGEFSWHELAALDYRAAFDFYAGLFAWDKMAEHDMGPMGIYLIFGRNGGQLGGMFNKGGAGLPGDANWLSYVRVRDVHATVDKIKAAGGKLAVEPMEVPGGDWIAQCFDPAGALFAVHTSAADVKAAKPAAKKKVAKKRSAKKAAAEKKASKKKATRGKATKKKAIKKKGTKKKATKKKVAKKKAAKKKVVKKRAAKRKTAKKKGKKSARKKPSARKATKGSKRKTAKKTGKKGKRKRAAAKKR